MRMGLTALAAAFCPAILVAQTPAVDPGARTVAIQAGPRYGAGPPHRFFLGPHYRKLWTAPIRVDVLDLRTFAGGLKPTKAGGGKQTKSLKFDAADGRKFRIRSVDKDPRATLPPELRDTFAEAVVQDQISAGHPAASVITDGLAEAAGLIHVKHRFVVLPDDLLLGEFRKEFGNQLYTIEEDPQIGNPVSPGFEGVVKLLEWEEMYKLLDKSPENRIDTRAFLKARLLDIFIGDWDRHQRQWSWALKEGNPLWQPVPEDRDQAFAKFDGVILGFARSSQPRFVDFEDDYPAMIGLAWNARFQDRRFLGGVERGLYEEVALELQRQLTDQVIESAARLAPPEYYKIDGPRMVRKLKARRARLPQAARTFYRFLAEEVELHGTAANEVSTIQREDDGTVEVTMAAAGGGGPFLHRRFQPGETREVRIYLKEGTDRAASRGAGASGIKVRVVGGTGADVVDDSAGGRTHFYDHEGENRIVKGPGTEESNKPYETPRDRLGDPLRDWGRTSIVWPVLSGGADMGVFLGVDYQRTSYGFRKHPYANRNSFRLGYSTALQGVKAEYEGDYRFTNSRKRGSIRARYSEVEIVRFHGFGNETVAPETGEFYKTPQKQYLFHPAFTFGFDFVDLSVGPTAKFTQTALVPGRFLERTRPYGVEDFGQAGLNATLVVDRRDHLKATTRGALLWVGANYYPEAWDVASQFGNVQGEMSGFMTAASAPLRPTLALRVGGKHVWGTYPFHEAAFIGGPETVRGLRRQRYAGDSSVYGNAELRLRLGDFKILVPEDWGVFGLGDAGRVWFEGEDSNRWHTGVGGGVWISILKPENTLSLAVARSEGRVRLYFQGGFAF